MLLDFWTLCCINCIHTLPDLAKLEAKYPGVLVVIGVHTPKFDNEKKTASIRKAILRYEIKHPVINDADHKIWDPYGVELLADAGAHRSGRATYYGDYPGRAVYERLDEHIGKLVKEYKDKKMLKETPLQFQLATRQADSPLYFPGKVLADAESKRLFIADSTNHRIVITDLTGKKIAVAGTRQGGLKDGGFAEAHFSDPQGMALDGETLYVADRKNHAIRALDLKNADRQDRGRHRRAGSLRPRRGRRRAQDRPEQPVGPAAAQRQDLHRHGRPSSDLDLRSGQADASRPTPATAAKTIVDGPPPASRRSPSPAAWRPTADTCTSPTAKPAPSAPCRSIGNGKVDTVVGEGLFEFGDRNGVGTKVRLQHALGVAYQDGKLYVADTYNSKIKIDRPRRSGVARRSSATRPAGSRPRCSTSPAA